MLRHRHGIAASAAMAAGLALALVQTLRAATDFEAPPTLKASAILPADMLKGEHHTVAEEVANDGYMNTFSIASDYGAFVAYGEPMVAVRVHEIGALAELDEVSKTGVFLKSAGQAAVAPVKTVAAFADKPVETVKGIPGGVKRLFKRTKATVEAGVETGKEMVNDEGEGEGEGGESTTDRTKEAAQSYARNYLGVTGAERRWAQQLEVDPYSSNPALRKAIASVAKVDAAARFATRLVMPSIPGIGTLSTVNDLVWGVDPLALKERNVKRLQQMGIEPATIDVFFANPWYSPSRQTYLIEALAGLDGASGGAVVLERAAEAESEEEAIVLTQSLQMYHWFHRNESPIVRLEPGLALPLAATKDGRLAFLAALDYLVWTADIAAAGDALDAAASGGKRELWLRGSLSARARRELEARGWAVRDRVQIARSEGTGESGG